MVEGLSALGLAMNPKNQNHARFLAKRNQGWRSAAC